MAQHHRFNPISLSHLADVHPHLRLTVAKALLISPIPFEVFSGPWDATKEAPGVSADDKAAHVAGYAVELIPKDWEWPAQIANAPRDGRVMMIADSMVEARFDPYIRWHGDSPDWRAQHRFVLGLPEGGATYVPRAQWPEEPTPPELSAILNVSISTEPATVEAGTVRPGYAPRR